jgi:hypothetical protein
LTESRAISAQHFSTWRAFSRVFGFEDFSSAPPYSTRSSSAKRCLRMNVKISATVCAWRARSAAVITAASVAPGDAKVLR